MIKDGCDCKAVIAVSNQGFRNDSFSFYPHYPHAKTYSTERVTCKSMNSSPSMQLLLVSKKGLDFNLRFKYLKVFDESYPLFEIKEL